MIFPETAQKTGATPELHLFIIWEHARARQNRILGDIAENFTVTAVCEITWSDEHFSRNLTRFYGQNLPDGSHKEIHCGRGAFLLVVVEDPSPEYHERTTSHGPAVVNVRMFDRKQLYRKWTGGGHRIHATDSQKEAAHDLALLMGKSISDFRHEHPHAWSGQTEVLARDLMGARGWSSITELFYVLNSAARYVVLRNFECLPDAYTLEAHGDIDLLGTNPVELQYVLNATPVFPNQPRVLHYVEVDGKQVLFDFRHVGDNYYDELWERDILERRIQDPKGFYRPNPEDYFYSLVYHALVHKREVAADYMARFIRLATAAGVALENAQENRLQSVLDKYLSQNGYRYTEPHDMSVYFNRSNTDIEKESLVRIFTCSSTLEGALCRIIAQTRDRSVKSQEFAGEEFRRHPLLRHHFSSLRCLPIQILDLPSHSRVIELGAESGVITRFLGERMDEVLAVEEHAGLAEVVSLRCRDLKNVGVLHGDFDSFQVSDQFDIAVVVINDETPPETARAQQDLRRKLAAARRATTDDGMLVLAIQCRMNDTVSPAGPGLGRNDLDECLDSAGYIHREYLTAYPNYFYAQSFFTDDAKKLNNPSTDYWIQLSRWNGAPQSVRGTYGQFLDSVDEKIQNQTVDSCVILAGKKQVERPTWLIRGFSGEHRRMETRTETALSLIDGVPIVKKTGRPSTNRLFEFRPNETSPYYVGNPLEKLFLGAVAGGNRAEFLSLQDVYCEHLLRRYGCSNSLKSPAGPMDYFVSGEAFDVVSRNIIVGPEGMHDFDKEWRCRLPVPLSFLCYRNLQMIAEKTGPAVLIQGLALGDFGNFSTYEEYAVTLLNSSPFFGRMSLSLWSIYDDLEKRFYGFVTGNDEEAGEETPYQRLFRVLSSQNSSLKKKTENEPMPVAAART